MIGRPGHDTTQHGRYHDTKGRGGAVLARPGAIPGDADEMAGKALLGRRSGAQQHRSVAEVRKEKGVLLISIYSIVSYTFFR